MKLPLAALYILGMFAAEVLSAQAPTVTRDGSSLTIEWKSEASGTWNLKTKDHSLCGFGQVQNGFNRIHLPKIVNADELIFETSSDVQPEAVVTSAYRIAGNPVVSALSKPTSTAAIYQLEVRTYLATGVGESNAGKLRSLTQERLQQIKDLGVDYLWLTGVLEHANRKAVDADVVKGDAGSYYAVYDSWDVSPQIGDLHDFDDLIERAHRVGLRVLIDFVSNHTARNHKSDVACKQDLDFGRSDQTDQVFNSRNNYYYVDSGSEFIPPYQPDGNGVDGVFDTDISAPGIQVERPAKVTGNDRLVANPNLSDWFETVKLNYGFNIFNRTQHYEPVPRTWNQMVDVARYWLNKGVDGFRVDFAHAVPIVFWQYFVRNLRQTQPNMFLLAEAYEEDSMRLPGFSYEAMFNAGFDSIYNSKMYWNMYKQAHLGSDMANMIYKDTPALRPEIVHKGYAFTNYTENHDEVRTASRFFFPSVNDLSDRTYAGLAYAAYLALLPGHFILHGGQELGEDASVFGSFSGDNGKTSIFDFVYQARTRLWLNNVPSTPMQDLRQKYSDLLHLRQTPAFNAVHSENAESFLELTPIDRALPQGRWIGSYLRRNANHNAYLVVINSDPDNAHEAVIHFTSNDGQDPSGALNFLDIKNDDARYLFIEVLTRKNWVPQDPNISGIGIPGWVLHKSGNVPSGLYLGVIPAATTYVFKILKMN